MQPWNSKKKFISINIGQCLSRFRWIIAGYFTMEIHPDNQLVKTTNFQKYPVVQRGSFVFTPSSEWIFRVIFDWVSKVIRIALVSPLYALWLIQKTRAKFSTKTNHPLVTSVSSRPTQFSSHWLFWWLWFWSCDSYSRRSLLTSCKQFIWKSEMSLMKIPNSHGNALWTRNDLTDKCMSHY